MQRRNSEPVHFNVGINFARSTFGDNGMADVIQVIEDVKKYDKNAECMKKN